MPRIDRIATYMDEWSGEYLNAQKMRSLAQRVNRGVQYALSNSKNQNIKGYELYRVDIKVAQFTLRRAGINPDDVFKNFNKKTGTFEATTSFKNFSQEQRQAIAGAFDYLAQNRSMSKSNWAYHYQENVLKPAKNTFITRHKNIFRVNEKYELMMAIFETDMWQNIRKTVPYDIEDLMDAVEDVNQLTDNADETILKWLNQSNDVTDFLSKMADYIDEYYK